MAQVSISAPGSVDPVGLITSGAVIPFLGQGLQNGGMSFLELLAPVDFTEVHMFLFDSSCVRGGPSINVPLTANDVALLRVDNFGGSSPTSGLITAGAARCHRVYAPPVYPLGRRSLRASCGPIRTATSSV